MSGNTICVGNVEITAVADVADVAAPCSVLFPHVEEGAWQPHQEFLSEDGKNVRISITTYLVRSAGRTILIDTGIGAKNRPFFPTGRLPDALAEAGVKPDDIDIVANTHMHIDHVGWHTTRQGETFLPTFPKSKIIFSKAEWDYFTDPKVANEPVNAHIVDCVLPLRDVADIELVDSEYKITGEITLMPTPGHSPAHQSFIVTSGGESAIIWGDICHHPAQVTEGWSPVFDMDPRRAQQTRERVLQRIEDERLRLVAGHFPYPGFGSITRRDNKRYWSAL